MLLVLAEVQPDAIEYDYTVSTENLRHAYLAEAGAEGREAVLSRVHCPGAQVHNMLAHLDEKYGGAAGYLRYLGLAEEEIDASGVGSATTKLSYCAR